LGDRGAQCDYVSQRSEPNDLLIKLMNDNPMKELTKSFGILSISYLLSNYISCAKKRLVSHVITGKYHI